MPSATVSWHSADADIAAVEGTGAQTARVVAVARGETRVVATVGSATASVAVAVEQIPASIQTGGNDLHALPSGTSVRVSVGVQDRNEHPISGTETTFRVEDGGGTVDPESVVSDAEGRAEATWTLGTAGAQTLAVTAGEAAARFSLDLCDPVVLDPGLRLGHPRVLTDSELDCAVAVGASEAGAYYRLALVGTSSTRSMMDSVSLSVAVGGASASAPGDRRVFASRGRGPASGTATDPHPGRSERNQRVLSWIARSDGPDPLPDLRATRSGRRDEPPERREFTLGSPGTTEDNCAVARSPTGVLLAHNDHIAIYADETLSPPVAESDAQLLADYYGNFGAPTLQAYFGGVGDVDGDGRILAFVEDLSALRVAAWVWMGDLLAKEDCPASNEAELMRISEWYVRPELIFRATGAVVHEAKHISSHHQLVRRAKDRGQSHFAVEHPFWVEEGTAEIATEISARLGWASIGGPPPGAMVRGSDLRRARDMWTPEAHGVRAVLENYGQVLVSQPNSVTEHDPYGAGWGFFRFLGDWVGGAGRMPLGDAAMFARLNDAAVSEGLDGIREVTGQSFEELMVAYAQAVSLAGTGAPRVAGVPRFSTYDMTGMNKTPFSMLLADGRFPYPVTITGSGRSARLWLPLAEPITVTGLIGPNGFRIHDFRAERAGDRAMIRVDAPEHVRLVVTRIPDQMEGSG